MSSCDDCLGPGGASGLSREEIAACTEDLQMTAVLHRFGLHATATEERFAPGMWTAALRCIACSRARQCRRYLAGAEEAGAPSAFCPNAPFFDALRRCGQDPDGTT